VLVSVVDFEPKKSWVQTPNRPKKKNKKSKVYQAIRKQIQFFNGFTSESTTETSDQYFVRYFEGPKLRVKQKTYEIPSEVSVERKWEKLSKIGNFSKIGLLKSAILVHAAILDCLKKYQWFFVFEGRR
jgi:hypothetical protein